MTPTLSPELEQVAKLLEPAHPQVVIVVGTGVAINATGQPHASWLGLLKHGIRYLVAADCFTKNRGAALEASLNVAFSPKFQLQAALQHAELVEQNLNTPSERAFAAWLESAFATFKKREEEKARAPLDALRDLHDAGALLLTTNYDSLLTEITGAPPVTWEEHADFHRVMTRQKSGILHIHGHWQRPSSIVLGRSSYDRVVADTDLQQLFRTLWLDWSWIYVGCGDGLDDPNLGRLLEWSKGWGQSGLPDFFLAREDKAKEIDGRPGKPPNLRAIGYPSHDELPKILRSVAPAARCWPFIQVDDEFPLFRVPGSNIPFPTRQEYLSGDVPTLAADAELEQRLQTLGWACVIDVASVGKTTLALRAATTHEQRQHPVFYLDLKLELLEDEDASPSAVVHRVTRPGTLLILDNVHHKPELARQLWQQWSAKPAASRGRLLLVSTRIHQVVVTPDQDLTFFENHPVNPAILLQVTPDDLGRVAKHIYRRVGGTKCPPMPEPPAEALAEWHRDYRAALNAFMFAAMSNLADFQKGKWALPLSRASDWVRKEWLNKLDGPELENAICLAAFGAQELEILVQDEALPNPGRTEKLFELGLVAQTERGLFKQHRQFGLREAGWGRLILAALKTPVDEEKILFATASRYLRTSIVLSARLQRDSASDRLKLLWEFLAARADGFVAQATDLPPLHFQNLVRMAEAAGQTKLADRFWTVLTEKPEKLVSLIWNTPLDHLAQFTERAQGHPAVTKIIWDTLENEPQKLAARALETQLHSIAAFLDKTRAHPIVTKTIWDALEKESQKVADLVSETPLSWIWRFIEVAREHPVLTKTIWCTLENEPQRLATFALDTPLIWIANFLERSQEHPVITKAIWDVLEKEPQKLAARALGDLHSVAVFLDKAREHPIVTKTIWDALENEPQKLAARALETQLHLLAVFLDKAREHPIVTKTIWDALENEPQKVAVLVWQTQLSDIATFLEKTQEHPGVTKTIWQALENHPKRLAALIWETPLGQLAAFLQGTEAHPLVAQSILEALRNKPERLIWRGSEAPFQDLVGFAHFAPTELLEIALRGIKPGHWNKVPDGESLAGATWVAWNCAKVKRDDLATDLIALLLRRANWQDFPPRRNGFAQACWLLANAPISSGELTEAFRKAVCIEKWLGISYAATSCGQLASGLRQLAMHQLPDRCRQFHHQGLGWRLRNELARFEAATAIDQSSIIQLLGCADLCGWAVSQRSLASITLGSVSQLPISILPHRPEAAKVEDHQMQLWLGLRAFVSITWQRLPLPRATIEETLKFWQANLGETASTPETTAHRMNKSMVAWLEACSHAKPPALLPSKEPLWVLAGFPLRLNLPMPVNS